MEEDIETVIDRLQAFVKANKRVSLKKASGALGLPVAQVEKLGLLLEESGLVRLDYKLSGIELSVPEEDAGGKDKKEAKGKRKKSVVLEELESLEREVLTAGNVLDFLEKDLERRITLVESLLGDLEKKPRFTASELERLKKEINLIVQQAAVFQDEVKRLEAKDAELSKIASGFSERVNTLESRVVADEEEPEEKTGLYGLLEKLKNVLSELFGGRKKDVTAKAGGEKVKEKEAVAATEKKISKK